MRLVVDFKPDMRVLPLALAALAAPIVAVAAVQPLVVLLAAAALWSAVQAVRAGEPLMPRKHAVAVGAIALFAAGTALWSPDPGAAAKTSLRVAALALCGLHLVGAAARLDGGQRRVVAVWLAVGLVLAAAAGVLEYMGPHLIGRLIQGQAFNPWAGKSIVNRAMSVLVLFSAPALFALLAARRRVLAGGLAVLVAVAVVSGDNTTAKVALVLAATAGMVAWALGRPTLILARAALVAAVVALPALTAMIPEPAASYDAWGWRHTSLHHRFTIWRFVGEHIRQKPLTGWGMDAARALPGGDDNVVVTRADGSLPLLEQQLPLHPHNAILQVWLELGLGGAAALAGLLWLAAGGAARLGGRWARAGGFATLTAGVVIASDSYGLWQGWWQAALWLAAVLVAACLHRGDD